jgi:hypothetical protein
VLLEEDVPPEPRLMESMRAVGYSLESAVADLVDNSISAQSRVVDIVFGESPELFMALTDDGVGMTPETARLAMRLAARSARDARDDHDLGRFGLGLKTASLSQCRNLTLVTKRDGQVTALRWSLNHLASTGRWALLVLDESDYTELPGYGSLASRADGTLVIWQELDRFPTSSGSLDRLADEYIIQVRDHLSLVFHRFLAGEHGRPLAISVNGVPLKKVDPFLSYHRATQVGPSESFRVEGQRIELRPYTLPFLNKLSPNDLERAQIVGKMRDSQGFYIYRARRLVIWGTWFRILPKDDLAKLARVQVDIPNSLDHLWALDIKKSAALPPPVIRDGLRRIVDKLVAPSREVHFYRGRLEERQGQLIRTWQLVKDRDKFRYQIDRNHPVIASFANELAMGRPKLLEQILVLLESSFPLEDVYNRLSEDEIHNQQPAKEIEQLAHSLWEIYRRSGGSAVDFVEKLRHAEPFAVTEDGYETLKRATES